ncbi:hypothetical protein BO78DRAFT_29517 [Aspergillus sclerotiicarbonarius CBS 121057]|uniref:GRF-like zinc ribbon domain-containing protein n=1 Tax=Aspergillus sclerotiicarbonarius (strain CBS 121057 / IBT 28362) TaxID=1448318 RepID=A0A319DT78_ASPSB|nr:hypothetical protein BO78DRAFT_29517 [Aspergillus sclerotiicarbonarius CBS 121057]
MDIQLAIKEETDSHALSWAIKSPPACLRCGNPSTILSYTRPENPLGNGGRPYYKCPCGEFCCFGDMRGVHSTNPHCYCSDFKLSKRQIAGWNNNQRVPRAIHYVCADGGCDFYDYELDEHGQVRIFQGPILHPEAMARMGF